MMKRVIDITKVPRSLGFTSLVRPAIPDSALTYRPVATPESDHQWFADHVHPHESALRAYLRSRFPALRDLDDVVQESYARVFKSFRKKKVEHPRSYLFTTARNTALDVFRKKPTVSLEEIPEIAEFPVSQENPSDDMELQLLAEAIEALPARCREVLRMRKLQGLSHEEIATRLDISKATVATQVSIGVRRCAEYLQARGLP